MNRSAKRLVAVLVVVGLIGGAIGFKLIGEAEGKAATKQQKQRPATVTVVDATPTTLVDRLETQGTLMPNESVELTAEAAGRVENIGFEEHAEVSEGDLLLTLDADVLRAQLESNRQQTELAEKTLERQTQVLDTGGVSQQTVDETKNRISVLDAERQRILAELDNRRVRAPFDGRIGLRQISPGDYVTPGSPIATLTMLDPIKMEFTVQARHVPKIEIGDTVEFKVDGREKTYRAEIYASDNAIDYESQTLTFAARASNDAGELMPGAFADVSAVLERRTETLAIPAISLVTSGEQTFTWVVKDGAAEKRSVQTGLRTPAKVEITDGLEPGETVVVTGRQNLTDGNPVNIKTENAFPIDEVEPDPSRVGMERQRLETDELDEASESTEPDEQGTQ
jgi:membrane fusion protein (multidrug efflux system)